MKRLVIIPTYNECENVARMTDKVMSLEGDFDLLYVDDGSPDGTADIIREKMAEYGSRVNLVERSGKLGLGTAYIAGFKWALERGYDEIFEMDCDFSHNPDDLLRLAKRLGDLDAGMLREMVSAEELIGRLAASLGLIDRPEPLTARELVRHFNWDVIPKEDVRSVVG